MKIAVINHSDTRGGASVVSRRLCEALRALGHDARMVVAHKETDAPYVIEAGPQWRLKAAFVEEHLDIFMHNGFNRADLFKVSTGGAAGIDLLKIPFVAAADAVIVNWVNQGMCSLKNISRLARSKRVIWTMHDMWNLTGICHHAGECRRYTVVPGCGQCPMLHFMACRRDLSRRIWGRKVEAYSHGRLSFVAVSNWLAKKASESSLMHGQSVTVIHNAFPVGSFHTEPHRSRAELGLPPDKKIILMAAARLDDPVKGLDYAVDILNRLDRNDALAVFVGDIKNHDALAGLTFPHIALGSITDTALMAELYAHASVLISPSRYETLPGTLVEAQAAGCTPVAFDRGGQRDIIRSAADGYLIPPYDTAAFAAAIDTVLSHPLDKERLRTAVQSRFSAQAVARQYLKLLEQR